MSARFIVADVFDGLATLDDNSVDLVFTSPPFLALRSYLPADHPDKGKEIGSESTPAAFLDVLLDVVEALDRVLAPHGTLCVELGDTYAGSGGAGGDYNEGGWRDGQERAAGSHKIARTHDPAYVSPIPRISGTHGPIPTNGRGWPLPKSLCGIPSAFALSLEYGRNILRPERETEPWRVRNLIPWCRPNPPVGALGDKFRPATSYVTVACKSAKRWFDLDAVRQPYSEKTNARMPKGTEQKDRVGKSADRDGNWQSLPERDNGGAGAPPLDWLNIPTEPYAGSHYATFPRRLVEPFVKAMCPQRVCTTCGQPSERQTEKSEQYAEAGRNWADETTGREKSAARERNAHSAQPPGAHIQAAEYETVGWSDCGHDTWRTGVVFDPFAGSGTTLAVAHGHGRTAIGIDIDERNAELARERVGGLFLEVEHVER